MKKILPAVILFFVSVIAFSQNAKQNAPVFTSDPQVIKNNNFLSEQKRQMVFTASPQRIPGKKSDNDSKTTLPPKGFSAEPAHIPSGKKLPGKDKK